MAVVGAAGIVLGGGCGAGVLAEARQSAGGLDGGYMRELARRQFEWHVPLFTTSIDLFQGIGDIFFPVNFRLFPGFALGAPFGPGDANKVIAYSFLVAELSIGVMAFARALGYRGASPSRRRCGGACWCSRSTTTNRSTRLPCWRRRSKAWWRQRL
jgi:hypothetical protein